MTTLTRRDFYTTIFAEKFSPCGNYLVTADMYGKISVFNITQALTVDIAIDCKLPLNIFQAHENSIYCFASTERYLISGGSTKIHGWLWKDILHQKKPTPKWTFTPPSSSPFETPEANSLVVDPSTDSLIVGCGDNNVYVWDLNTGDLKHTLRGHEDYIHCVEFLSKTNQIISAGEDGLVKFWDMRSCMSVEQIAPNELSMTSRSSVGKWVSCIATDKTEDWLVCGGAAHSSVWHLRSKTATAVLSTPKSCAQVIKFEDDFILTAGTEPNVFKWSINGELRTKFPTSPKSIFSLEVNEHSNRVLAVSGSSPYVDISTNFKYKAFSLTVKG
ncbi:THO complex subunit 6 homolog [Hydractinia symbiolongicarpus]|uniref:THO complex subunit 6 homolog n=1 Tax=Hydractinia symbiolongicarpus TaxID=13093 RepID=UPI00254E44EA|nr:THO complex subunit 6 homolog [Hydractinia symbiolongicarpus]